MHARSPLHARRRSQLARTDTWQGWTRAARDTLIRIVEASPTADNRRRVARARGVLAFEFRERLPTPGPRRRPRGQPGVELQLAAAYVAVAQRMPGRARRPPSARPATSPATQRALVRGKPRLLARRQGRDRRAGVARVGATPRPTTDRLARASERQPPGDALAAVDRVRDNPAGDRPRRAASPAPAASPEARAASSGPVAKLRSATVQSRATRECRR